jgi:hypothetical protein
LATKTGWPDEIPSSFNIPSGDFTRMEMLSFERLQLNWKKTTLEIELAKVEEVIDHNNELMDGIASELMAGIALAEDSALLVDIDLAKDEIKKDLPPTGEEADNFDQDQEFLEDIFNDCHHGVYDDNCVYFTDGLSITRSRTSGKWAYSMSNE